ncbi:MAG TPA: GIY-YIG nuclease family protein [Burkholderiales bacterium]|nr:GIY-YIG nuclease family protein [Burkholderiales bacterium]
MTWHVYILQCGDGSFYTGVTSDPERRLLKHNKGEGGKYTRSHLPVRLVWIEEASNRAAAQSREASIKRLTHIQKFALACS